MHKFQPKVSSSRSSILIRSFLLRTKFRLHMKPREFSCSSLGTRSSFSSNLPGKKSNKERCLINTPQPLLSFYKYKPTNHTLHFCASHTVKFQWFTWIPDNAFSVHTVLSLQDVYKIEMYNYSIELNIQSLNPRFGYIMGWKPSNVLKQYFSFSQL